MNKNKKTLSGLLLATSLFSNPVQATEEQVIKLNEQQFKHCKILATKITLTDFLYQAEIKKAKPHLDEHRRLYDLANKINNGEMKILSEKMEVFPDPVPSDIWGDYTKLRDKYNSLKASRDSLYDKGDIKYKEYEKFKPAIDAKRVDNDKAWDKYEKYNCTNKISASNRVIEKHCPKGSNNRFCKIW